MFVQGISLRGFSLPPEDETHLSAKYFEVIDIYYTTVYTVTIFDQIEEGVMITRIYKCSFECKYTGGMPHKFCAALYVDGKSL